MSRTRLLACGAAFAGLVSWSAEAGAFCRTTTAAAATQACTSDGLPLYWRNECRGIRIDLAPIDSGSHEAYIDTLKVAVGGWDRADCPDGSGKASITFDYLGETTTDFVGYKDDVTNENAIFFRTSEWEHSGGNQVALTTVTFRSDTGEILDADIEVNSTLQISAARPLPAGGFDLQTVFAHELGHVLGLAHSADSAATMYATYKPGTTEQGTLDPDDLNGLCSIYLPDGKRSGAAGAEIEAESCDPEADPLAAAPMPKGGCGCHTSDERTPASFGLAATGVLAWLALARGRRRARG